MPHPRYRTAKLASSVVDDEPFERALRRIRDELGLPAVYPAEAAAEAADMAHRGPRPPPGVHGDPIDATDLALLTIDPEGSRDLDQAVGIERRGHGYRVHYAIADVASFVVPGGALDTEVRQRGLTLYLPDERVPLHPPVLSEGAASLLPDQHRPALLWLLDLDADGELERATVERATVRSREQLSYVEAQDRIDAGHHDMLQLLREVGERRVAIELARGGVSLRTPVQEVSIVDSPGAKQYALTFETTLPVENWNAQISLLTGMAAARIMLDAGVGVLRTLPRPRGGAVDDLRHQARALGIAWPASLPYAERMSTLDMSQPASVALATQAARSMRGAGYLAFTSPPGVDHGHWAIAADYAHVTAPLRRLVDRFALEIVVAVCAGRPVPEWVEAALPGLPRFMDQARSRERAVERAVVDVTECLVLSGRVGEQFEATVTAVDERGAQIVLSDPPVVTLIDAGVELGSRVAVTLASVDLDRRRVTFELSAPQ